MQKTVVSYMNVSFLANLINLFDELFVSSFQFEEKNEIQLHNLSKFISDYKKNGLLVDTTVNDIKIEIEVIIFFFIYARYTGKSQYDQLAENQLDSMLGRMFRDDAISDKNDLLAVGGGLLYLLRNRFVEGEEDDVLLEIDTVLLKILINIDNKQDINWYNWIYYFRHRLSYEHSSRWEESSIDFEPNVIYLLDCLKRSIQHGKRWDYRIISEIENLHQMKIHPEKRNFYYRYLLLFIMKK